MREYNQTAIRFLCEGCDNALDLGGIVHVTRFGLDCQSRCCFLDRLPHALMRESFRVHDRKDSGDVGCGLLEHLKPLATHRRLMTSETGDIAARASEAGYKAATDRIADTNENDRHTSRNWLEHR